MAIQYPVCIKMSCLFRFKWKACSLCDVIVDLQFIAELKLEAKVRGVCFYAVTSFAAIFLFVFMLVGHPSVLLFDRYRRKFHYFVAKVWAKLTVTPFFKIEYEGLENLPPPDTPAVYVSNHQSFLDIYTLLTLGRSFKFISKTGIFLYPIIGWAMFLLGVIPLKRMDSRSQMVFFHHCLLPLILTSSS
jgi:1-acyl-sn-glycerol-3-phosphate acyltransferase